MSAPIDWDHVYLLCWFDKAGRRLSTSWDGPADYVHVVVKTAYNPPMWSAPVPHDAEILPMPSGLSVEESVRYAASLGGFYAFGWLRSEPIDRKGNR